MTVKQISIFLENRPESLMELTDILAKRNINMRALCLADTNDFGIARIIVDDPENVASVLKEEEYIVKASNVIALEIPDETGSLNKILKILGENGRNVEYMYGFTGRKTNCAFMVLRCTDIPKTEQVLESAGIRMLNQSELREI
ncbi:MAG: amino acid-binding protein [Treponema sp.]|nr:amino acid-binding protein [Treponema sp.]MBP5450626.1 amino acid-binding protein [Treponema sp.]